MVGCIAKKQKVERYGRLSEGRTGCNHAWHNVYMPLIVFDCKGTAVEAGGKHVKEQYEEWIAADPFRGGVRVLINRATGLGAVGAVRFGRRSSGHHRTGQGDDRRMTVRVFALKVDQRATILSANPTRPRGCQCRSARSSVQGGFSDHHNLSNHRQASKESGSGRCSLCATRMV